MPNKDSSAQALSMGMHIHHWCEKPARMHLEMTENTEAEVIARWNERA
jgi:hypothetical protein